MTARSLGPFGGLVSAVDPSFIPDHCCQDMLNMYVEDGRLSLRRSYRQMAAAGADTACYGFSHLVGYNASYTEVEEFVKVATIGGNTRAHSVHPTTGAVTAITNGGTPVNLHASDWSMIPFDDKSYWINPNNTIPVYKHTIGTATSFSPITLELVKPLAAMPYEIRYSPASTTANTYDKKGWSGLAINATDMTALTADVSIGSTIRDPADAEGLAVAINTNAPLANPTSFTLKIPSGADYTYRDLFMFQFTLAGINATASTLYPSLGEFTMVPGSLLVSFQNAGGDVGGVVKAYHTSIDADGYRHYYAYVSLADIPRASRAALTKIKFTMALRENNPNKPLRGVVVHPYHEGMVDCSGNTAANTKEQFSYSWYNSSLDDESPLFGAGTAENPYIQIANDVLRGFSVYPKRPTWYMGTWVKFTVTASSDAAYDKDRLYVGDRGKWRRFDEIADGGVDPTTATTYYRITKREKEELPLRSTTQPGPFPAMKCAAPFKGWMIWGVKGGAQNIKHSGVGTPERLRSAADLLDDTSRGGDYSLGDNYGDEPVCIVPVGDVVFVCGSRGVYAQVGNYPWDMTPFKRIHGSKGVLNQFAACRWKDDNGTPGLAFATRDGIFFVGVNQDFVGDNEPVMQEISGDVRDRLGLDALVPISSEVRLVVDENQDALFVAVGTNKCYALRRPSLVDGVRRWEYYEYRLYQGTSSTSFKYWVAPVKYGIRVMTDVAHNLELEFHSGNNVYMDTASYQWVEGNDQGFVTHYWTSKDFDGPNRRVVWGQCLPPADKSTGNGTWPLVEAGGLLRSGGTAQKAPTQSNGAVRTFRWSYLIQGAALNYKLSMRSPTVPTDPYRYDRLDIYESDPLGPRRMQ